MAAGEGEVVDTHNLPAVVGVRSPEVCTSISTWTRTEEISTVPTGTGWAGIAVDAVEEGRSRLDIQTVLGSPTSFTLSCGRGRMKLCSRDASVFLCFCVSVWPLEL
jgi:hypothetical protein